MILERKHTTDYDDDILDLSLQSIDWKEQNVEIDEMIIAGDSECMRPDLISFMAYGDVDQWDLICKFNQISNPFSLDIGDVIYCPNLDYMMNQLHRDTKDTFEKIKKKTRQQYYDKTKKSIGSSNVNSYHEKIKEKMFRRGIGLPPNMSVEGSTYMRQEGNKIYLGESE